MTVVKRLRGNMLITKELTVSGATYYYCGSDLIGMIASELSDSLLDAVEEEIVKAVCVRSGGSAIAVGLRPDEYNGFIQDLAQALSAFADVSLKGALQSELLVLKARFGDWLFAVVPFSRLSGREFFPVLDASGEGFRIFSIVLNVREVRTALNTVLKILELVGGGGGGQ
ncbi:MAG: hypothetical protein QXX12_00365 [Nanopusillaceae archaeon]